MPALDCLVIGGGPAGLTAAIYLARFHLSVMVVDAGDSRAESIPLTRNHAGFPGGIVGTELVARMRAQAAEYGVNFVATTIDSLAFENELFTATAGKRAFAAATVLLATGVVNHRPPGMSDATHHDAVARSLLRYCPICDGYEVTDKAVAVLGTGARGFDEARFLRSFTNRVTLISPTREHDLDDYQRSLLSKYEIALVDGPAALAIGDDVITAIAGGRKLAFDAIYPALGSAINSGLAAALGATCSDEGCLMVDEHMRTDVPGLYAAGDVVKGLDQISHAMGQGGVAATAIRNDLATRRPPLR